MCSFEITHCLLLRLHTQPFLHWRGSHQHVQRACEALPGDIATLRWQETASLPPYSDDIFYTLAHPLDPEQ